MRRQPGQEGAGRFVRKPTSGQGRCGAGGAQAKAGQQQRMPRQVKQRLQELPRQGLPVRRQRFHQALIGSLVLAQPGGCGPDRAPQDCRRAVVQGVGQGQLGLDPVQPVLFQRQLSERKGSLRPWGGPQKRGSCIKPGKVSLGRTARRRQWCHWPRLPGPTTPPAPGELRRPSRWVRNQPPPHRRRHSMRRHAIRIGADGRFQRPGLEAGQFDYLRGAKAFFMDDPAAE